MWQPRAGIYRTPKEPSGPLVVAILLSGRLDSAHGGGKTGAGFFVAGDKLPRFRKHVIEPIIVHRDDRRRTPTDRTGIDSGHHLDLHSSSAHTFVCVDKQTTFKPNPNVGSDATSRSPADPSNVPLPAPPLTLPNGQPDWAAGLSAGLPRARSEVILVHEEAFRGRAEAAANARANQTGLRLSPSDSQFLRLEACFLAAVHYEAHYEGMAAHHTRTNSSGTVASIGRGLHALLDAGLEPITHPGLMLEYTQGWQRTAVGRGGDREHSRPSQPATPLFQFTHFLRLRPDVDFEQPLPLATFLPYHVAVRARYLTLANECGTVHNYALASPAYRCRQGRREGLPPFADEAYRTFLPQMRAKMLAAGYGLLHSGAVTLVCRLHSLCAALPACSDSVHALTSSVRFGPASRIPACAALDDFAASVPRHLGSAWFLTPDRLADHVPQAWLPHGHQINRSSETRRAVHSVYGSETSNGLYVLVCQPRTWTTMVPGAREPPTINLGQPSRQKLGEGRISARSLERLIPYRIMPFTFAEFMYGAAHSGCSSPHDGSAGGCATRLGAVNETWYC